MFIFILPPFIYLTYVGMRWAIILFGKKQYVFMYNTRRFFSLLYWILKGYLKALFLLSLSCKWFITMVLLSLRHFVFFFFHKNETLLSAWHLMLFFNLNTQHKRWQTHKTFICHWRFRACFQERRETGIYVCI